MLNQLAALREEHLVLIGFISFFVMLGTTILGTVLSVQWRKARQTEMELWFKHEMSARGMSIEEIQRLMGGKEPQTGKPQRAEPAGFAARPQRAEPDSPIEFKRRLVRQTADGYIGGLCAGLADYLRVSPTILRGCYVFATLCTGVFPLLIGYFIACCFIPSESDAAPAMA